MHCLLYLRNVQRKAIAPQSLIIRSDRLRFINAIEVFYALSKAF
ncbi:MAG: hypothetical protein RM338_18285 [Nostoc sp. DedQUE12a]|nr:hypothetical protein [Nostoc sp. DedQUE12a]